MGWHSNFLIAKQLYVDILEILITVADVRFCFNQTTMITKRILFYQVIEAYFKIATTSLLIRQ
jgi:hypothetical protein